MVVTDASAILEVLLRTERATAVEKKLFRIKRSLHAPHLLDLEVAQVLRRYSRRDMTEDRAHLALLDFNDFSITRYPHDLFTWRIWELRRVMSAYDAVYIALAEVLRAPLVTCDALLASTRGHSAKIELVG